MTQVATTTVAVTINGANRQVPGGGSLLDLLTHLELDPRTVVVEHNRVIVRRAALGDAHVGAGDQIEIVHFVGGG